MIVAEAEATFTGPKTELYTHLCAALPSRSKEAIKGLRNKNAAVYQQLLCEAKSRLKGDYHDRAKTSAPTCSTTPSCPRALSEVDHVATSVPTCLATTSRRWRVIEFQTLAKSETNYNGPGTKLIDYLHTTLPSRSKLCH